MDPTHNRIDLHLFGSPRITWRNETVDGFVSNKARALLFYLATTHIAHSRDALADLLWSDTPATAKSNLRKVLSNLRNLDGIRFGEDTSQLVALDLDNCWVDVTTFKALANGSGAAAADTVDRLARVAQLYRGDFLAGFNISLSAEFEAWALGEQTRLKAQMAEVLHQLTDSFSQREELPQAIATLRRLLALEPWREEAHRQLIGLLALNNDASAALVQFEICRDLLRAELDVEPGAATCELVAKIRAGTFPATGQRPVVLSPSQRAVDLNGHKWVATTVEYPLMGRENEWEIVRAIWQGLDRPHCIALVGEAGIGKTRLTEELLLLVEGESGQVARTRSHALQGQLAYGPITDWLRSPPLQSALSQLEQVWLTEIARLLPELFIAYPALAPPRPLQESWQRKQLFDALVHVFSLVDGPLLLVLDDLQWCDEDTLEWLQYLLESVHRPLLVMGTVRGDEIDNDHPLHRLRPQLLRLDKLTELHLTPLSQGATTELANHITQQKLSSTLSERLFQETAGNPLFVVESMRTSPLGSEIPTVRIEAEPTGEREQLFMPAKMYQVIQARLTQLSPEAQTLAQLGATIGRSFDVALLAEAAGVGEEAVLLGLDELWQRRIVREVDSVHFDFSHDRIRDVAYAEISPIKRRLLHRQVANALAVIHAENLEVVLGHLAVHYAAAGMLAQALTFHQRAADGAMRLFAHQEALNHRQQALAMLRQLPKTTENRQAEIDLLLALSEDQTNAFGKGSPVVDEALRAAYTLVQKTGTLVQQVKVLNALCVYDRVRGRWAAAHEVAVKSFTAATKTGNPALVTYARFSIACVLMRTSNLEKAHAYFEKIQPNAASNNPTGVNVGYLSLSAYTLWLLGFPEQASQRAAAGLRWAKGNDQSLQIILHHYCSVLVFCRDLSLVDRLSAELVELTTKRNDEFSLHWGKIYRGWLLIQQGDLNHGIPLLRETADDLRAMGNYFYECYWRALLAEAYLLAFDLKAALREIDSTLAYAQESGDHHLDAQFLKLRGDCLLANGAPAAEIEGCYQLAIDTARQQKSRSLELRASISLCRLWQKQGKVAEAYSLLAAIYGWFTEGFETADLVEAKVLLDELQPTVGVEGDAKTDLAVSASPLLATSGYLPAA